jgi:hypothetical protein
MQSSKTILSTQAGGRERPKIATWEMVAKVVRPYTLGSVWAQAPAAVPTPVVVEVEPRRDPVGVPGIDAGKAARLGSNSKGGIFGDDRAGHAPSTLVGQLHGGRPARIRTRQQVHNVGPSPVVGIDALRRGFLGIDVVGGVSIIVPISNFDHPAVLVRNWPIPGRNIICIL